MANNIIPLFGKSSKDGVAKEEKKPSRGLQLSLPFAKLDVILFVYSSSFAAGDDFLNFLNSTGPRVIADMRLVPRLDFVRPSRTQTFDLFSALGVDYRDILGRAKFLSYAEISDGSNRLLSSFVELHSKSDQRPILALFDDSDFFDICRAYFDSEFEIIPMDEWAVRSAVLDGVRRMM